MATGLALGAMLPDIDLYPTSVAFLAGHKELVYAIHRTATHSLAAAVIVAAIALASWGKPSLAWWCGGFALGVLTHIALDLFFWFEQLDVFWPFSHLPPGHPLLGIPNLWARVHLPPIFNNPEGCRSLRDAFEFAAIGAFLVALDKVAPRETGKRFFNFTVALCWVLFLIALVGVALWPWKKQIILVNVFTLLYLLPYAWIQTVKRGPEIGAWCLGNREGRI